MPIKTAFSYIGACNRIVKHENCEEEKFPAMPLDSNELTDAIAVYPYILCRRQYRLNFETSAPFYCVLEACTIRFCPPSSLHGAMFFTLYTQLAQLTACLTEPTISAEAVLAMEKLHSSCFKRFKANEHSAKTPKR
jgi:hypothetical protein